MSRSKKDDVFESTADLSFLASTPIRLEKRLCKHVATARMSNKRKASELGGGDALVDEGLPSETISQIQLIMGFCRGTSGREGLPLCFVHQLYAVPRCNKTLIDTELKQMREGKEIRLLHTPVGMAVAVAEDYARNLAAAGDANSEWTQTRRRFLSWLAERSHISASRVELKAQPIRERFPLGALTDDDIDALLARGYLAPRRDLGIVDVFWLSHPDVNGIVCSVGNLRKQILQAIKRSHFKELGERELGKRKFEAQIFQRDFYYYDLLGVGDLVSVQTPRSRERIFRLASDKK